ncbi:RNA-binding motif protein, Y chromosome, family 1 member F/J-like isoform X1 [Ischnura elegans]|uniref:RNA-binding motif protein, Y chromosome, family 1 member F/J-like isoform X1 n=1 Tax=Ischnura elegans TaxID=197161 RepID=UPI001ED880C6|nr:RNA-binding motif protein, Y chromosome, family 1 member F/J-like isoform X1 [Ischnura elegans]XP_046389488.1 RNA-binding motif protein, Y chromosome, family 1 member F/J-like isoform X1 [Ischnura elegans]
MSRYREWDLACKVYVGNLGSSASKHEIESAFGKYGPLRNVWVARNPPGFAFVEFEDPRDAEDAVRGLDGTRMCGTRVRVEMSTGRSRRGGGGGGGGRRVIWPSSDVLLLLLLLLLLPPKPPPPKLPSSPPPPPPSPQVVPHPLLFCHTFPRIVRHGPGSKGKQAPRLDSSSSWAPMESARASTDKLASPAGLQSPPPSQPSQTPPSTPPLKLSEIGWWGWHKICCLLGRGGGG